MWSVNSMLGRVRGLFRPDGIRLSDKTLGIHNLRQEHNRLESSRFRTSFAASNPDPFRSWLRVQYGASDVVFTTKPDGERGVGKERRRSLTIEGRATVGIDRAAEHEDVTTPLNNSTDVSLAESFKGDTPRATPVRPQIVSPLDLCTTINKSAGIVDILGSPKPSDAGAIEQQFCIKAVKVDPVPIKPLCKYNRAGAWQMQAVTTINNVETSALLRDVSEALKVSNPALSALGTGGAYFLSGDGGNVAVFKPADEEPRAPNNPKNSPRVGEVFVEGLKKGTRPGEGAWREYTAYLIDHRGFSGVPLTVVARLEKPRSGEVGKLGSLQQFVRHNYDAEECGTSLFPKHEVHKLCVLDMRIANTDRNGQNILVGKSAEGEWSLTPIDHGYAFPDCFDDVCFEWMYWPQAEEKFSETTAEYVAELNPETDISLMAKHGVSLRPACLDVFRFSTYLLKWGVRKGLTPYEIAGVMCKDAFERYKGMPHAQVMLDCARNRAAQGGLSEELVCEVLDSCVSLTAG
ncbi:hypothetical protein BSKO_07261 [Bryopsis sp. KO-2023]|nr:hypothetical protein BSKO_07261 [Bryopsis sp. KO-2023]